MTEALKPDDPPILYRLWSNRHSKWWKPGALGYTSNVEAAGLYTWTDAMAFVTQSALSGDRERVSFMVAAGRVVETPEAAEEVVPLWADDLLRAYLCGHTLDFGEHHVPSRVRRRLEEAGVGELSTMNEEPHRPFR